MSLTHYVWIYGLAEALAVAVLVAAILGSKWWRLRREHLAWLSACERIDGLIHEEIARARDKPTARPELRDSQILALRAVSRPFRHCQLAEEDTWSEALDQLDRCFEGLRQTTSGLTAMGHRATSKAPGTPAPEHPESLEDEGLSSPEMDSEIEALLAQNRLGRSAFSLHRESGVDLKQRYRDLLHVNQGLRGRIDSLAQTGTTDPLREELDAFLQSNLAFMQAAFATERNFNLLEQQFDDFEERIHNLQVTINTYRKSVHKLVTERDLLNDEKLQYLTQLDLKEKVIARLNRNYENLRREYAKIYGVTS